MKKEREEKILKICPNIPRTSGIYVFMRDDDTGLKMAYCGQAVNLLERCAAHLGEYDHIGVSLKKRGFVLDGNPFGWKLQFREYPKEQLDEREQKTILELARHGYQLYNKTGGGQGKGKSQIGEYKPAKGYRDGLAQGKKMLARELSHIIEKHLTVCLQNGKEHNKISQKAFDKFWDLLDENNY